ncbi:hypothetical protein Dsin_019063 [Dipteronia sinensis]|uniref:C2H2-type domain-containing protein n=1 Tax=Dipteronia sinensis TaxID=43782 RepID=A0AAE0E257_9ROSI|nr:hypothetical protein Dsin_019063 [Dipteronia sinensis]
MNSFLVADREKSENQARTYPCAHCDRVFTNYQALGGHIKVHNAHTRSRMMRHHPSPFSNYIGSTNIKLNPLPNNQPENSSNGPGNNLTISKKSYPVSASKFSNTILKTKTQFLCPQILFSARSCIEIHHSNHLSSTASASFDRTIATSSLTNPKFFLGSNVVHQFNTDEKRTCRDGRPLLYGDASKDFTIPISGPSIGFDLNQSPDIKETNIVGFSPTDPCPDGLKNFQSDFNIPVTGSGLGLDLNQSPNSEETNIVGLYPADPCPDALKNFQPDFSIPVTGSCLGLDLNESPNFEETNNIVDLSLVDPNPDALKKFQLNFSISVAGRGLGFDLNQTPDFKETNTVGFSAFDPCWDEGCHSKKKSPATEQKTQYSSADTTIMSASKRPRLSPTCL